MRPDDLPPLLMQYSKELSQYARVGFPKAAGNITLRFINGNFRAQGYQGKTFMRWTKSKGRILVKSGALRAANYYTTQPAQVTIHNSRPYAKVHNEGFKGRVSVSAHRRYVHRGDVEEQEYENKKGKMAIRKVKVQAAETVKAHTRMMRIPKRQFMPIVSGDAPVLTNSIQRSVTNDLFKLFK